MPRELDDATQFRPNLRPIGVALVVNLLFGGVLLGLPYLRGQARAERSIRAFGEFAACLFEGEVREDGVLALPRGERARFASLALTKKEWPLLCRSRLAAIAHEPAAFLFPGVKSAEEELRASVARLDRALSALGRERERARIPEAPLLELSRLQGILAALIDGAGLELDPMREAISLADRSNDLATPSIVPIRVGAGSLELSLREGELVVTAMDARRVGYVKVDSQGRVEPRLARRSRLMSALVGASEPPWVFWSTPASRCDGEDGCAHRATGVAPLREDGQRLSPLVWLQAHPIASPRASVHVDADSVWIAAKGARGELSLRRFALPPLEAGEEERPRLAPSFELDVNDAEAQAVHFWPGDPPALVWAGRSAGLVEAKPGARPKALPSPAGHVLLASCGSAQNGWLALASERGVRLHRAGAQETFSLDVGVLPPEAESVRLVCREGGVDVLLLHESELRRAVCDPEGCGEVEPIASKVDRFDAAQLGGALLVAWSTDGPSGPVRVTRIVDATAQTTIPAPCWEPSSGLCGAPRLVSDSERAMLVTREGGDLRVVATEDGLRWRTLPGLEQP